MAVRQYSQGIALASAARTATVTLPDLDTGGSRFLNVVVDTTAFGTGSVTLTISGLDMASGKYYLILSGAAIVGTGTVRYKVGPNVTASANSIAQDYLPATIQLKLTANNANTQTYSVGYSFTG